MDYDAAPVYFVLSGFVGIIEHCNQRHGDIQSVVKRSQKQLTDSILYQQKYTAACHRY